MAVTLNTTGITFSDGTSTSTNLIPAGTLMLFQQTAAPTGWTKQTTHNDKALRVVSGTAGSGGTSGFTTVFTNQTPTISVSATTLSTAQMPSHTHTFPYRNNDGSQYSINGPFNNNAGTFDSSATGGGGSHTHSVSSSAITLAVQYVDLIIASKN